MPRERRATPWRLEDARHREAVDAEPLGEFHDLRPDPILRNELGDLSVIKSHLGLLRGP